MTRLKLIALCLLLVAGGLIAMALLAPALLVRPVANLYLSENDLSIVALEGLRLSAGSAAATRVEIEGSGNSAEFDDLTMTFQLRELLSGEVQGILIASANIGVLDEQSPGEGEDQTMSEYLALLQDLPLERLAVTDLSIAQGPYLLRGGLSLQTNPLSLQADGRLDSSPDLQLHIDLQADAQGRIGGEAELLLADERLLISTLQLDVAADDVRGEVSSRVNLRGLRTQQALAEVAAALQPFANDSLQLDTAFRITDLSGEPALPQFSLILDSAESALAYSLDTANAVSLGLPLGIRMNAASLDGPIQLTIDDIGYVITSNAFASQLSVSGQLAFSSLSCELAPRCQGELALQASSGELQGEGFSLQRGAVQGRGGIAWDGESLRLSEGEFQLRLPQIDTALGSSAIAVSFSNLLLAVGEGIALSANFTSDSFDPGLEAVEFIRPSVSGDLVFEEETLGLSLLLTVNDRLDNRLRLEHSLASSQGSLVYEMPPFDFGPLTQLSNLVSALPVNLEIVDGNASAGARLQWRPGDDQAWQVEGPVNLRLEDLSGYYEENVFSHFDTVIRGELTEQGVRSLGPQQANLAVLDVGMPIEDVAWRYEFDSGEQVVSVQDLSTAVLGGRVSIPELRYSLEESRTPMTLVLTDLDVESIVGLANYPNLEADGRISGYLPLLLEGETLTVDEGLIAALNPGGTIRYTPNSPASTGNTSLQLVNDALSNYQYQRLNTQVYYQEDGDLVLDVALEGINPDMNGGQPINLNVNIENNIPEMLRSLRASRTINELLEEALQQQ